MKLIVKALDLKNGRTIIDLGAGDGIVIFEAARSAKLKSLNTHFIAVEINPILITILHLKRLFHSNYMNIRIVKSDMFTMDYSKLLNPKKDNLFYLYISPWHMEKTIDNIQKQIKKYSIVSYMYPVKSIKLRQKQIKGLNSIFIYGQSSL